MPFEDTATSLVRPDEGDLVSSIPTTEREFVRRLAPKLLQPVADPMLRPNLGLSDYALVPIPSRKEVHEWDGIQWLVHDTAPKRLTEDTGKFWRSGSNLTELTVKSGDLFLDYQRMGRWVAITMGLRRAADSNVGGAGEYYTWQLPFAITSDWIHQVGSGHIRLANGAEYSCTAAFRDSTHFYLTYGGTRVGQSTFNSWNVNDRLSANLLVKMGGYK